MAPAPTLSAAFNLAPGGELIALTGGGGKTSLLFALSRELAAAGRRVVAATTTRIATAELLRAPAYFLASDLQANGYARLDACLEEHRFCFVVGAAARDKVGGLPLELPARLLAREKVDFVLVEADGARMRPVKAPAAHEPAVPPETTLLIPMTGIDALSTPLQDIAHRPHLLAALLSISLHESLRPKHVAVLLNSAQGALRHAPPQARIIPFINKVQTAAELAQAHEIARLLFADPQRDRRIQRLVIGALQHAPAVRGIVKR